MVYNYILDSKTISYEYIEGDRVYHERLGYGVVCDLDKEWIYVSFGKEITSQTVCCNGVESKLEANEIGGFFPFSVELVSSCYD